MIALCRRRLALVWFCLLLAALPRALLPAGTMPEFSGGGVRLGYCISDDGGQLLKQLGDPVPPSTSHAPSCPYALAQGLVLPGALPTEVTGLDASSPAQLVHRPQPSHTQHPPRPPSQAPPTRIEALS